MVNEKSSSITLMLEERGGREEEEGRERGGRGEGERRERAGRKSGRRA